jgi:hypothetical protein
MPSARIRHGTAALLVSVSALCMLAFVSSASAAITVAQNGAPTSQPFGCRASLLRTTLGTATAIEPSVANPTQTPCANDSKGVSTVGVPAQETNSQAPITVGQAGAFTYSVFDPTFKTAPGATAVASVSAVNIPTSAGTIHIAGPIQASASDTCVNDQLVQTGQSNLDVISVNGQNMPIPPGQPYKLTLANNVFIAANQQITTPNSLTERVLEVKVGGLLDVVVGEAVVSHAAANPCAGTKGITPVLEICPKGSTLNAAKQFCFIKNCTGGIIIVSRPFRGPSGGTVEAVCAAKKKYKSPCLSGPGPKFVLIATAQGARVEGTLYSDRIIALGAYERVAGLGGNDCINGKALHQKLYDGNGHERVYADAYARVAIGSGNSLVVGGTRGHDWLTVANGNTRIYGHGGHNRIDAGLGRVQVFGGPGPNRVFTPSTRALVNCGTGGNNTAFLRDRAIPFARAHGCTRIVHLV